MMRSQSNPFVKPVERGFAPGPPPGIQDSQAIEARTGSAAHPYRCRCALDTDATWQEQLRALFGSMLDALRAHPTTVVLVSARTVSTEESLRTIEVALDILRRRAGSRRQRRRRLPATR